VTDGECFGLAAAVFIRQEGLSARLPWKFLNVLLALAAKLDDLPARKKSPVSNHARRLSPGLQVGEYRAAIVLSGCE
jgi:hypothetical protein